MLAYIGKRLLLAIPTVFGVATLAFFLMKLSPADPAAASLGDKATAANVAALRHAWGLDRPVLVQYVDFLGQLVQGKLGTSYAYRVPVVDVIATRLPATLELLVYSVVLAVVIALPLSLWVVLSRGPVATLIVRVFTATVQGMPTFFIGSLLIAGVALPSGVFPTGGFAEDLPGQLRALTLPALTVALSIAPLLVRSLSNSLAESFTAQFTEFARAKGLPQRAVVTHYVLRNGSISGVSILGIQTGVVVGGAVVVESVFAIPGVGGLLLSSVLTRDLPVVQALTLVFGVLVVLVYLLTDIVYGLLDPRARPGRSLG